MKFKSIRLKISKSLIISFLIALFFIFLRLIGIFEQTELNLFDFYYKLAPNEPRDERIVLVGITEADIAKLKTNRLSDLQLYQILSQIKKGNPAAVGIDIFRDHPVPPNYWELQALQKQGINALNSTEPFGHKEFISIFNNNPNFFAISKQAGIKGDKNFDIISPPPVLRERIADIGVARDSDGTQRRGLLYPITQEPAVPSLSWALAEKYLVQRGATIKAVERNNETHLKINKTMFWKFRNYTGAYVRADEGGYQVLLNWRKSDFKIVSVSDVLENKVNPLIFKGRIVIIGAYAPSLNDKFLTPLNPEWAGSPRDINGIEAIAQVTSYIISAVLDGRPTLQTWREPWISFAILTCGLVTGYFLKRIPVEQLNVSLILVLLINISLLGFFCLFLSLGYWLPIFSIILVISSTAITLYFFQTTAKRKTDYNSIKNLNQERQDYINQLEDMIDKRQHYRIVYNSFLELGNKIIRPIESLTLTSEDWRQNENEFVDFLENLNISNLSRSEGKKLLAQLMIRVFKFQENVNIMIEQLSLSIPNLYHLSSQTNLIEFNNALKSSLEEICNLYLDSRDLRIDIRPLLTIEDTRTCFNYIETYRLKSLLTHIMDQPIRLCYLQEKKIPLIKICLVESNKNICLKIYIFLDYEPNNVTLYFCQNILNYYTGNIQINHEENQTLWLINFNL